MAFASGYSLAEAQLLLTLAAAAYVDEKPLPGESIPAQTARMRRDIDQSLHGSPYAAWKVAWGPGLAGDRGNMMYVAGCPSTNQYAIAVRGTDWSFWLDWVEDFASLLPLVPFGSVLPAGADGGRIAAGTEVGLLELTLMSGETATGAAVDLLTFLRGLPPGADISVTGHSLGGCLATVLAAWLASALGSASRLKVYTFAAPTAGDGRFAAYYNHLFTDPATGQSTAYRVYNTLDSVPDAWASLATIATYFSPSPRCPDYLKEIIAQGERDVGTEYVQVGTVAQGSAVALTGHVVPWSSWWNLDPTGTAQFAHQVGEQHATATYLGLLAAPPMMGATVKLTAMHARMQARRR